MNWYKIAVKLIRLSEVVKLGEEASDWDPVRDGKCVDNEKEWRVSELIEHAKDLPVTIMGVDELLDSNGELQVKGHMLWEEIENPSPEFMKRVRAADMQYPILVSAEGWIMDGAHRLAKAKLNGMKEIAAKIIDTSTLPGGRCREEEP